MNFADGSCTFVAHSNFPWWRVDLGQDEFVTEVYLVNIKAQTRLGLFEIRVGRLIHILTVTNIFQGSKHSLLNVFKKRGGNGTLWFLALRKAGLDWIGSQTG